MNRSRSTASDVKEILTDDMVQSLCKLLKASAVYKELLDSSGRSCKQIVIEYDVQVQGE